MTAPTNDPTAASLEQLDEQKAPLIARLFLAWIGVFFVILGWGVAHATTPVPLVVWVIFAVMAVMIVQVWLFRKRLGYSASTGELVCEERGITGTSRRRALASELRVERVVKRHGIFSKAGPVPVVTLLRRQAGAKRDELWTWAGHDAEERSRAVRERFGLGA